MTDTEDVPSGGGAGSGAGPAGRPGERRQRCLRSRNRPVEMSPHSWTPPWMRRPVQTMISVRAGRIARTDFSDTISPFALRRPFFVTGSSPSFATLRRYAEATGTRLTVGLARADG